MKIADNEGSDSEHQEIEATMKGPKVLDAERFPQIMFKSTGATTASDDRYQVTGELSLHGTTRSVTRERFASASADQADWSGR